MQIQDNVSLKPYTTFLVGGPARYFAEPRKDTELIEGLDFAHARRLRYFVLGGGSNLVFPDSGFDGVVIRPQFNQIQCTDESCYVGASVILADLITATLGRGFVGLEFAAGIPGTVGGAIRGNAGTYGVDMSSVVARVTYVDETTRSAITIPRDECGFTYRHSMFKEHAHIITSAHLRLKKGNAEESRKIIDERLTTRINSHPTEPSAGCIFKNVEFAKVDVNALRAKGLDLTKFEKYQKIPSGYLIEQLGLKGKTIGGAQISPKHANYIINRGTATYEDIIVMISYIKQQVRDSFGIQLEEEVHLIS